MFLKIVFMLPRYVLLHEVAYRGSRVGLEVADSFSDKRPASVAGREIEGDSFVFGDEIEDEKNS